MIKEAIAKVVDHEDLNESAMMEVMDEVMEGKATPAQIAAFMTALNEAREWQVEAKYTTTAGSTFPLSPEINASGSVEFEICIAIRACLGPLDSSEYL